MFKREARKIYRFVGEGKDVGKVPRRERVRWDDWKRRDGCSGRRIV